MTWQKIPIFGLLTLILTFGSLSTVKAEEPGEITVGIYKIYVSSYIQAGVNLADLKAKITTYFLKFEEKNPQPAGKFSGLFPTIQGLITKNWQDSLVDIDTTTKEILISVTDRIEKLSFVQNGILTGKIVKLASQGVRKVYYPQIGGYKLEAWNDPKIEEIYRNFEKKYKVTYEVVPSTK